MPATAAFSSKNRLLPAQRTNAHCEQWLWATLNTPPFRIPCCEHAMDFTRRVVLRGEPLTPNQALWDIKEVQHHQQVSLHLLEDLVGSPMASTRGRWTQTFPCVGITTTSALPRLLETLYPSWACLEATTASAFCLWRSHFKLDAFLTAINYICISQGDLKELDGPIICARMFSTVWTRGCLPGFQKLDQSGWHLPAITHITGLWLSECPSNPYWCKQKLQFCIVLL